MPVGEAAETGEGAGTEADGGEVALAAFDSPSFFSPVVLSERGSANVGFRLSAESVTYQPDPLNMIAGAEITLETGSAQA